MRNFLIKWLVNIATLFIDCGDMVVISSPTYSMYRIVTELCGGKAIEVQRDQDFNIDIEELQEIVASKNAKLIFICKICVIQ